MSDEYILGVEAAAHVVKEHIQFHNEIADRLLDLSDGRMSVHPADRMKAKRHRETADLLRSVHQSIEALLNVKHTQSD